MKHRARVTRGRISRHLMKGTVSEAKFVFVNEGEDKTQAKAVNSTPPIAGLAILRSRRESLRTG